MTICEVWKRQAPCTQDMIAVALALACWSGAAPAADITAADLDAARATVEAAQRGLDRGQADLPIGPNLNALPQPAVADHPIDIELLARHFDRQGQSRQNGLPQDDAPHLLVFVSLGMPAATLERMMADAEQFHVTFVLRGMIDRDMQKTMQAVKNVIGQHKVAWFIDPDAFKRFAVTAVPSYVLLKRGAVARDCGGSQCFADGDFAKVSGDVSIDYALNQIGAQPQYREVVTAVRNGPGS